MSRGDASKALQRIRRLAALGRVAFTRHARLRMGERGASTEDVREALVNARTCTGPRDDKWRVLGPDLDGDDLELIVAVEDDVIVVTLF